MSKIKIRMFPDYCSSGVWGWNDGVNLDQEQLGISSALKLALKYWHSYWEYYIADSLHEDTPKISDYYIKQWHADGKKIAELMTVENDTYEFVYHGGAEFNFDFS